MHRIVACAPNLMDFLEPNIAQQAEVLGGLAVLPEVKPESTEDRSETDATAAIAVALCLPTTAK